MHELMIPWLARRPPLIDNAGAPVLPASPSTLSIKSHTAHTDQAAMLHGPPARHIAEDRGTVPIARATQALQLALLLHAPP